MTRRRFEDYRPYDMPVSLDDLRGPSKGSVDLPITIYWAPGDGRIPLDSDGHISMIYQAVIAEGSAEDQREYLNKNLLVDVWPKLHLPIKVTQQWQSAFSELQGNPRAEWLQC